MKNRAAMCCQAQTRAHVRPVFFWSSASRRGCCDLRASGVKIIQFWSKSGTANIFPEAARLAGVCKKWFSWSRKKRISCSTKIDFLTWMSSLYSLWKARPVHHLNNTVMHGTMTRRWWITAAGTLGHSSAMWGMMDRPKHRGGKACFQSWLVKS